MRARSGVDPRDPQCPKLALSLAAVAVRVLPRLRYRLFGHPVDVLAPPAVAFREPDHLLVPGVGRDPALYSWHVPCSPSISTGAAASGGRRPRHRARSSPAGAVGVSACGFSWSGY